MKSFKNLIIYFIVLSVFGGLIYLIIRSGKELESTKNLTEQKITISVLDDFLSTLKHNITHPLAILLIQIFTIIFTARTFGFIFNKIGQPTVIGEIIAGIFLGPSLLGMWFPEYSSSLFPIESLGNLHILSQIGLVLFMFVIGMELDLNVLKNKTIDAFILSHIGIIIPYSFGLGLSIYLYREF